MPGAAGMPVQSLPASTAAAGATGSGATASPSPKLASTNACSAANAAAASSPCAVTTISSPWRTPNVATWLMLLALAWRPSFCTISAAAKRLAAVTNCAAGRACSPRTLRMINACSKRVGGAPVSDAMATSVAAASGVAAYPSCCILAASAPLASAITWARLPPTEACTAAATAPSTSGASHRCTWLRQSGGMNSSAMSALNKALPRSIKTTTPAAS